METQSRSLALASVKSPSHLIGSEGPAVSWWQASQWVWRAESSHTSSSWRCQYGGTIVGVSPKEALSHFTHASKSCQRYSASSAVRMFQLIAVGGPSMTAFRLPWYAARVSGWAYSPTPTITYPP